MLKRARYKTKGFFKELSEASNYLPDEVVNKVYYGLIKMLATGLAKNGSVACPDLGVFFLHNHKARQAMNINTGKIAFLGERNTIKFKPCKKLKAHFYKLPKKSEEEISFML